MENVVAVSQSFWETKTGQVLRWIGVLPCSILGTVIVSLIVLAMCLIGDLLDGSFWMYLKHPESIYIEHFFTPFIISAVFGGCFVHIGTSVAPVYKKAISYVLALLVACLFGFTGIVAVLTHQWQGVVQAIIAIASAGIVSFNE